MPNIESVVMLLTFIMHIHHGMPGAPLRAKDIKLDKAFFEICEANSISRFEDNKYKKKKMSGELSKPILLLSCYYS